MNHHPESRFLRLLGLSTVFSMSEQIVNRTLQPRKYKNVKLGNAIITFTALVHNCQLIGRTIPHLKGIENPRLILFRKLMRDHIQNFSRSTLVLINHQNVL